ncbi:MAG: hypothetical protein QG604_723 [Candidatus Dependentiae bacterium]|nr:hypothetical protein [Candidatus Dependentiae bacterium]
MKNKMLLLIALAMSVSAVHAATEAPKASKFDDVTQIGDEFGAWGDTEFGTEDRSKGSWAGTGEDAKYTPGAFTATEVGKALDDYSTSPYAKKGYVAENILADGNLDSIGKYNLGMNQEGKAIEEVAALLEDEPSLSFGGRVRNRYSNRRAIGGDLTQMLGLGAGLGMAANGRRLANGTLIKRYIASEKARLAAVYSAAAALGLLGHVAGSKISGDENLFTKGYNGSKRGVEKFKANRAAKKAAKAA